MRSRVRFPWFYHGNFSLQGKIPVVTTVWVFSRFRLKAPPGISSSCISPLTSSGQRSRASWASQPQKSATLSPQPRTKPRKFITTCGGIGKKYYIILYYNLMGPQSYMRSVVDRNVVMRRIPVQHY